MDENEQAKPGLGAFYGFMLVFGVLFLAVSGWATEPGPGDQGWWTQPAFMPRLSLMLVTIPAMYLCYQHFIVEKAHQDANPDALRAELFQWFKPAEFFVYYVVYIFLLSLVGYFLSSLIFVLGLSWRVGLRSRQWQIIGLITAVGLIIVFRWGLQVWIDPALLYEIFPRDIRIFLSRYF